MGLFPDSTRPYDPKRIQGFRRPFLQRRPARNKTCGGEQRGGAHFNTAGASRRTDSAGRAARGPFLRLTGRSIFTHAISDSAAFARTHSGLSMRRRCRALLSRSNFLARAAEPRQADWRSSAPADFSPAVGEAKLAALTHLTDQRAIER